MQNIRCRISLVSYKTRCVRKPAQFVCDTRTVPCREGKQYLYQHVPATTSNKVGNTSATCHRSRVSVGYPPAKVATGTAHSHCPPLRTLLCNVWIIFPPASITFNSPQWHLSAPTCRDIFPAACRGSACARRSGTQRSGSPACRSPTRTPCRTRRMLVAGRTWPQNGARLLRAP